jgi:hypothetical protein
MIQPLRIAFDVACDQQHAFSVWTEHASAWWPKVHTVSRQPDLQIVFEPRVGGRIFERSRIGQEHEWGEITVWDPPRRLAYLWRIATERSNATDVEIRFLEMGPATTRVEVEHGGWDRLGPATGQSWRESNQDGWDGTLPAYIAACARTA